MLTCAYNKKVKKIQEANDKVIYNHKQFTSGHVLLGPPCVSIQPSFHLYVIKIVQLYTCSFIHKYLPFQSSKAI